MKDFQIAQKLKNGKCSICGFNGCPAALDFHHRNPSEKLFSISANLKGDWELVRTELDKCNLLCSNCHRTLHYYDRAKNYNPSIKKSRNYKNTKRENEREVRRKNRSKKMLEFSKTTTRKYREMFCWPPINEVVELVRKTSFLNAGKQLGVSDNAIRKFLKRNGITPRNIRNIKDNRFTNRA